MNDYWWVGSAVSGGAVIIGWAFFVGRYGQKVIQNCRILKELQEKVEDMSSKCGSIVGTDKCKENQAECSEALEKKLDEQSANIHSRIDDVIRTMNEHMVGINRSLGKIEGHLGNGAKLGVPVVGDK